MAGIPPGLAKYIAEKRASSSNSPSPLQQAAATKMASKTQPAPQGKFAKKKKAPVKMVPDTDQDGM